MTPNDKTYRIGDVTVTRIDAFPLTGSSVAKLYPDADPGTLDRNRDRLSAGSLAPETGNLIMSVHSWLVRTPHHTILVDTAAGNHKNRPLSPALHQLDRPYLARLAAVGVQPEDVDYVLITHIHSDHVGWNTRLVAGQWVPTFPNARFVLSRRELHYTACLAAGRQPDGDGRPDPTLGSPIRTPSPAIFEDSVRPVLDAGLVDAIVIDGHEFLDGLSFLPTAGHTVDHASIRLVSRGEEALFAGDVLHHPLQVYEPTLNSCFCEFPDAARRSRLWALGYAADHEATVFSTHFAETSAGRVIRKGDRFAWHFI